MSRKKRKHSVDPEATKAKGFLDRKSYVTWKGKTFLGTKDWEVMRKEVYLRDGGLCQICWRLVWINNFDVDHYPISRGKGGDDVIENLRLTHHDCHMRTHRQVQLRKVSL